VDKRFDQQQVFEVVGQVRAAGINVIGNYIFGLPEDDAETMGATLDLAVELNCEFANFYSAMAYPGSPLYDRAVRQGVPLPAAWTGYSQHSRDCLPLPTRHLPAREVLAFRDKAFASYYTNPYYLDMVQHKFGRGMAEHIQRMTDVPLERDLLSGRILTSPMTLPPEEVEPTARRTALAVAP
jgi:anaerobic magnesium-protoporphyrin IX monomethyl ester cyclase